ncbi:hypothetical protein KRX51_01495 [Corynebacterium sp. TAE3-ERU12]|uniref:hypothetical protein n=1 Tax=Corynebacterium sp. TAE3-ERU12 TaxID=2849491 RepID=UPI001C457774|nr:hypothetical protein [Corynebacterium sp. TAE3-ERU12]MBV7294590.1 hypothetical protein [Corynebacterium sp. TAE3-ERU12]
MSMMSLRPGRATAISARGMVHVEAHPIGGTEPVVVDIRGAATVNRVSASAVKIIRPTGVLEIVVRPESGGVFGPNQAVLARVVRGRLGTPGATGVELPRAVVDGCGEYILGTLTVDGDQLQVAAPGAGGGTIEGPAATVRAGLRARLGAAGSGLGEAGGRGVPVVVHVDASASMMSPDVAAMVDYAAEIIAGTIAALPEVPSIEVHSRGSTHHVDTGAELIGVVRQEIHAGRCRIGALENLPSQQPQGGAGALVWCVSDAVPAAIRSGATSAVALVLGDADTVAGRTEVAVDKQLARALADGDICGAEHLIDAVLTALPGTSEGDRQ